jgi:glutamyl-tRNA synthetase
MNKRVRVRFAPSPTGPLHIGGVRTALYNYLFAKKHDGDFLLRIEDTDQGRFVPGAEEYIVESLKWAGIMPNEGVGVGGPHAPYRQSERKDIYHQFAEKLVNNGNAYFAFDKPDELEKLRKQLEEAKASNTSYNYLVRGQMKNSLTLSPDETKQRIATGEPFVVRIKMPENETITAFDLVRGQIEVNTSTLDDKVLFKSDGLPTYHLANVVDDHLMEITHVIRGEEWLPSLPLHVLLYRYLGWEDTMPQFAHLPLLLKPDGKGKLSKRDGDKIGFHVFPLQWMDPVSGEISSGYRESGYFPEAFINMLAFLGWNPGTEQELFSVDDLAQHFSIEHVHKAGARFDFEKAKWFNHKYLVNRSNDELGFEFEKVLKQKGFDVGFDYVLKIVALVKERVNFVHELWAQSSFFFEAPQFYDPEVVKKRWKDSIPNQIAEIKNVLKKLEPFTAEAFKDAVHHYVEEHQANMGSIMNSLRLSLVGGSYGPDLPLIAALLGKDEVIDRIDAALQKIQCS